MLTGATRLVGLIGSPVAESLSPRMQNAAFAARGLDWAYVPLPVEADDLEAAVAGLPALGFAGANVTVPYKTAVLAYCDELDKFAERAGSVNTIVVRDKRLHASSTDGLAVAGAVHAEGARVLILGAGGAAQAIATALVDAGAAAITLAARKADQAKGLALRIRTIFPDHDVDADEAWPPQTEDVTLIVNATPMRDVPVVELRAEHQVVELAYSADGKETGLVVAAREAGCKTVVDGLEILLRQGAASFERWTGLSAPADVMRAALRAP
ncbi:MAG: shikimate dehydrogenase [Actinomycetota bacterium]|nr:shikimate dehydrogenase [Actinomycetota bacterium]